MSVYAALFIFRELTPFAYRFNDYNFLMDVAGNDVGALHGLSMLQEELPAEVSFHVPEVRALHPHHLPSVLFD